MIEPADAIVTGFTKSNELCELSLASLRQLRGEGVIRNIHCVTWSKPELDPFVAPLAAMADVNLVRVPEPEVSGSAARRGTLYQVANLATALALIDAGDRLVVKLRPDFIFSADFLRDKLANFGSQCAPARQTAAFGVELPHSPMEKKIWVPWAEANHLFFYEDAAFIGLKRDLMRLVSKNVAERFDVLGDDEEYQYFSHVLRYGSPFLARFPMFKAYFENCALFGDDMDYRVALISKLQQEGFFLLLIFAHAWILFISFHVDCGEQDDVRFYPNLANPCADWNDLKTIRLAYPYDKVAQWRLGMKSGQSMFAAIGRPYGRLFDDRWQHKLFTEGFDDFPAAMLQQLAQGVAGYGGGALAEVEADFYSMLKKFHRDNWLDPSSKLGLHVTPLAATGKR